MALTQENVHYTLNSGPGQKSNRFNARIQEFCQAGGGGGGGGGVKARRPENSLDNVFLVINLFYNLQRGSNGFITDLWFSREGGPDPLTPLWIRTWGRLTPLFAYRIMVYQNLNKTEDD